MKRIIHNLRQQPESTKRHILNVSMVVAGLILVSLWVYSLGSSINDSEVRKDIEKDLAPLSVLKNNLALPQW